MSKVIPPEEPGQETKRQSIDLPLRVWKEIDEVSKRESKKRTATRATKTQVVQWLLEYALHEYWIQEGVEPQKK